jgi:hypothetical protein
MISVHEIKLKELFDLLLSCSHNSLHRNLEVLEKLNVCKIEYKQIDNKLEIKIEYEKK